MEIDLNNFWNNINSQEDFSLKKEKLKIFIRNNIQEPSKSELLSELNNINVLMGTIYKSTPWYDYSGNERKNSESQASAFRESVVELTTFAKKVQLHLQLSTSSIQYQWKDFIEKERIDEIRNIQSPKFDTKKLLKILEEINDASVKWNFITIGVLCRVFIDHIPPIFWNAKNFWQVIAELRVKNDRSLKEIFETIQNFKPISDLILHEQISQTVTLPNESILSIKPQFDRLLQEVIKKLT